MMLKVLISLFVIILYAYLFKKAGGSVKLVKLNIISFSFYLLLFTSLIGGIAIFLGFRNHYVILSLSEEVANKGFYIIAYSLLALPFLVVVFNRLLGIRNYEAFFSNYIRKPIEYSERGQGAVLSISVIITMMCFASVVYTLYYVGFIPLIEVLKGNFSNLQSGVAITRGFGGNVYIRNIFAIGFTPIFSYFTYIYYYYTKKKIWKWQFVFLFILSILIKTYDLSKAPVIIYLFFFYFIQVLVSNSGSLKKVIRYGLIAFVIILVFYYVLLGYAGSFFSLTNGPMSRIVISQIAGLFKHVEIFPSRHSYLNGASFPKSLALLIGAKEYGQRSGRIVMSILYPSSVADNTSGVMNTLFAAEAYANYGIIGVVLAPIVVAFCISVLPNFVLKQRKTPMNMTIYVLFAYTYTNCLIGGFVDYLYNPVLIVLLFMFLIIKCFINSGIIHIKYKQEEDLTCILEQLEAR